MSFVARLVGGIALLGGLVLLRGPVNAVEAVTARREVDQATFQRVFAGVLESFQELERRQATSAVSGPRLGEVEQLVNDVELKLLADDFPGAEAALARLETQVPNDPRVRSLRERPWAALSNRFAVSRPRCRSPTAESRWAPWQFETQQA